MGKRVGSVASNHLDDSIRSDMQIPPLEEITYDSLESRELKGFFKKMKTSLERFTRDWNDDESKRDKTYTIFNQLKDAQGEMQDNLKQMLERDGKIEESLVRGQQLHV